MSLEVKLQVFEGPLDLLLHLIDKNQIDIYLLEGKIIRLKLISLLLNPKVNNFL